MRLTSIIHPQSRNSFPPYLIGILPGEGIGQEIIDASVQLLKVVEDRLGISFDLRTGGKIGKDAIKESGKALSDDVIHFSEEIFRLGGPLLCGPGGERFVYDLRRQFDLYCKLAPIDPMPSMAGTGPLKSSAVESIDILVVRENTGGLYQGDFGVEDQNGVRHAYHRFDYTEAQVARIIEAGCRLALQRRGKVCVVTKPGGVPSISRMWEELAMALCSRDGITLRVLEVDNACYQMISDAASFDVVVAPNMFGDVIADNAALLLGSRGMSYSANYSTQGMGVYQTGHGAAHDLTGLNKANPIGQMLSLAMLLRESFGMDAVAAAIRDAINDTVAAGWRTADIAVPGCRVVGTRELSKEITKRLDQRLEHFASSATISPL